MADISTAFEYDRIHVVDIKNPVTMEPMGIKIGVVSKDSRRVTSGLRGWQSSVLEARRKAGDSGIDDANQVELIEGQSRETIVHAIASWDWGDNNWAHISGATDNPSLEDRRFLVDHPNSKWLVDQIAWEVADIENFTQKSQKPARRGSRKM